MKINATTPRTPHNGQLAAVRHAVLRSGKSYTFTRKGYAVVVRGLSPNNARSNTNNQLLSVSNGATGTPQTLSYTYDANGNTTNQTDGLTGSQTANHNRTYGYDTSDRLVEVRDGSNALIAVYSYDPFGRRLSKDTGTKKIYYLYNEEGLIAEADASGQLTKSYGYAPQSSFTTNPLWMKSGNGSIGSTQAYYTYQNDHLGTPQKLLTQSGQTVWSATYDSYGNATIDPAYTIVNNLRNPGQYADQETGLHYNWNRYYDPRAVGGGRYITSDPIGLRGGINMYTYVEGNPTNDIDPTGEFGVIGAAIGFGFDFTLQMMEHGGNWRCLDMKQLAASTILGAVGGGFGGRGLTKFVGGFSRKTKGNLGENLSLIENYLKGSVQAGERNSATILGQTTEVDSTWRSITGKIYYVESKFGKSSLTSAQRRAQRAMGDAYHVERWGYPFFERVGEYLGGTVGAITGSHIGGGDCLCQ